MNDIYSINKQINAKTGADTGGATTFELVKAQVAKLGGDLTKVVDIRTGEEQVLQYINGGGGAELQDSKSVTITENGTHTVSPDEGYDAIKNVVVDVNVAGSVQMLGTNPRFSGNMPSIPSSITFPELASCVYMFNDCKTITTVPLFDTSNVKDMSSMFNGCTALTTVPLFDTSNVTDMRSMFYGCVKLTSIPEFNTANITDASNMFTRCFALETVAIPKSSKITSLYGCFAQCPALKSVTFGPLNKVKTLSSDINGTFFGCSKLEELYFYGLGDGFTSEQTLDLSDCDKLSNTAIENIIDGLFNLSGKSAYYGKIKFSSTVKNKLTTVQKNAITNKKWNLI